MGNALKAIFNKGSGKVKVQHWTCPLKKHQNGGNHSHVAWKLTDLNIGSMSKKASHNRSGLCFIPQIDMTTTALDISTSARKIHQSTTVSTTVIWKINRLHERRS